MTSPELAAAYNDLDTNIRRVATLEGWEGMVTDWVIVAAAQNLDDNGGDLTYVGRLLPEGGRRVPYYRVMGLLDVALSGMRNDVSEGDEDS